MVKVCGSVWTIEARKESGDLLPTIPGIMIIYFILIAVYVNCKKFRIEPKSFLSTIKPKNSLTKRYTNTYIYFKHMFQLICCWRFNPNKDGSLFEWASGEPNDSKTEDCVEVTANTKLNDEGCGESRHGLCEIKVFDCWI